MSYKDMFGADFTRTDAPKDMMVNPATTAEVTMGDDREDESAPQPLAFEGFSSRRPFLVERPTAYIARMNGAAEALLVLPDDDTHGGYEGRVLFSPLCSLPFLVLHGDEMMVSADAASYPLLHAPDNHPYDPNTDLDLYALALTALHTASGLIHEDGDGNLLAYPVTEGFTVDDDTWEAVTEWASDVAPHLQALNTARLLGFAMRDPDAEADALSLLFSTWGVESTPDEIIRQGQESAELLRPEYNAFIDAAYHPFEE